MISCEICEIFQSTFFEEHLRTTTSEGEVNALYTVLSPINGHSKKLTPPISGRIYFPRQNSSQTLIKNFLKSGQAISEPSV